MSNLNNIEFPNMTDAEVCQFLSENKFIKMRKLEDGEWIGMIRLAFTWAVCCGISKCSTHKYRWCFEDKNEAILFFYQCKDYDDIPEQRNSLKGHRYHDKPLIMEYDEKSYPKW